MHAVLLSTLLIVAVSSIAQGVALPVFSMQAAPPESTGRSVTAAEFNKLRVEGFDAIYSLDYQTARDKFNTMTRLSPSHPAGYVYLANDLWLETLNKSRRLMTSVYTGSSFYQEVKKEDRVDPKRDREFADLINKALNAARTRLAENPKDAEALYYEASALGLRAAYSTSVKRSFTKAIGDANQSIQLHKRVLKLDPGYVDSYLSIGLYDYVVGSLPFGWRLLARFAGLKGNKQRGIQNLEKVVKSGKLTQDDARVVLIGIYSREGQPERSLALLTELAERYPRNYLLRTERASMFYRLGRPDEGSKVFADLLKEASVADSASDLVYYSWGVALSDGGQHQPAIERYAKVKEWPRSDANLVSLSILGSGKSLDALGKRAEAVTAYQAVLKRENVFDSHKQASEYLKKPFAPSKD
jgi:tetratricopeptide (TPR) repeat protein